MTASPSTRPPMSTNRPGLAVRETACKTVLNRSSISDYTLNCYTGCAHGCVYCYARFIERFHPHPEAWGRFVDVKLNAAEALRRQLRRARPGRVFVSSACDGWQPIEAERGLTRRCCELLLDYGFQVNVLTKSALVLRDLDLFAGRTARIGVTITTPDERLARLWEPGCAGVDQRFRVIDESRSAGLQTAIMFGPLLPWLSDDPASLDALLERAADLKVDELYCDALNPRPRVWPSVAELLRNEHPDLRPRYQRVLFDRRARREYLDGLRDRVARAAKRHGLTGRLTICF